jgi:hypothetical protein
MEIQKEGNKPITVFIKESVQKHQSDGRKVLTGESSAPGATGPHLGMCVVVTPGEVLAWSRQRSRTLPSTLQGPGHRPQRMTSPVLRASP